MEPYLKGGDEMSDKMSDIEKVEARRRSKKAWLDQHMEVMSVSLRHGVKDVWKGYAAKSGVSLVEFLSAAVEEKAQRDGLK